MQTLCNERNIPSRNIKGTGGPEKHVLTATTAELQALLKKPDDKMFAKSPIIYTRVPDKDAH